jgi:hypothetical protein
MMREELIRQRRKGRDPHRDWMHFNDGGHKFVVKNDGIVDVLPALRLVLLGNGEMDK